MPTNLNKPVDNFIIIAAQHAVTMRYKINFDAQLIENTCKFIRNIPAASNHCALG